MGKINVLRVDFVETVFCEMIQSQFVGTNGTRAQVLNQKSRSTLVEDDMEESATDAVREAWLYLSISRSQQRVFVAGGPSNVVAWVAGRASLSVTDSHLKYAFRHAHDK